MPKKIKQQLHCLFKLVILPLLCAFVIIMVFLYAELHTIEQWLTTHHTHLWLWRLGLLGFVFISWPTLVRYRTKHLAINNDTLHKLIQQRYVILFFILLYETINYILVRI